MCRFPPARSGDPVEPPTEPGGRVRAGRSSRTERPEMKRALLLVAIGTVVTSGPRPATADPTRGPFRVMGPDGTVVRISSEAAEAWWMDYHESRCVTCRGPHQAAVLLDAVEKGLGGRFHSGPRYLILVSLSDQAGRGRGSSIRLPMRCLRMWCTRVGSGPVWSRCDGTPGTGPPPGWRRSSTRRWAQRPRQPSRERPRISAETGPVPFLGSPALLCSPWSWRVWESLGEGTHRRREAGVGSQLRTLPARIVAR
jgi:hypothetical protein